MTQAAKKSPGPEQATEAHNAVNKDGDKDTPNTENGTGKTRRVSPKPAKKGPIPPTLTNIAAALSYLSPDMDRETWVRVLSAVKSELGDDGRDTTKTWSERGESYNATDFRDTWKSIKSSGKTTIATLWKMALDAGWKPDSTAHQETEAERQERERQREERNRKAEQETQQKRANTAKKAAALWKVATDLRADHPYVVRKGINPVPGLREIPVEQAAGILGYHPKSDGEPLAGRVILAPVKVAGKLSTLEMIDEQGRKSAIAGGAKAGGFWAAQPLPEGDGTGLTLAIGEGVATVLSTQQATGYPAIAALSAGNIPKVAKAMRDRYPVARLLVLGDIGNGFAHTEQAAKDTGAVLAVPEFAPAHVQAHQEQHGKAPNDWNDLAVLAGLDEVERQLKTLAEFMDISKASGKENISEESNPTLPTLSTNSRDTSYTNGEKSYTPSYTAPENPTPKAQGDFVYIADNGVPKLVIDSKGARIMAGRMREAKYAYDSESGSWHRYTGHCWALLSSPTEPERFILQTLFEGTAPIGFRQAYFNGLVNIMLRAGMLPLPPKPEGKIPFLNGMMDIATKHLEPTTPANAATFVIPHHHTESTDCPVFQGWLRSATGNDDGLIQLLRAFIAAALTGRADLQKFLHLLGPGGTGKSTFIRLLFAIVGQENAVTTDLKQLEQNRFEPATLHGKRLAAITDSDKYGGSVNVLKAVTGQDPIRHERKHVQQAGTFVFEGMVVIASNEPLASTDYTSGLERRRLVVKFDRRIPPNEKAAFLAAGGEDRLHREIPAIINWALELSRETVTAIFMNPPAKAAEAAFEALTAQNPIAEWITENLIPAPGHWVGVGVDTGKMEEGRMVYPEADTKLYPSYLAWCRENRREPLSLRRFRHTIVDIIKTLGTDVTETRRRDGQGVQGVRLRTPADTFHPWNTPLVQDQSYTPTPEGVGKNTLEAAPVQDVQSMQDFSYIFVGEKNEHPTYTANPAHICRNCANWSGDACNEGRTVSDPEFVNCGGFLARLRTP